MIVLHVTDLLPPSLHVTDIVTIVTVRPRSPSPLCVSDQSRLICPPPHSREQTSHIISGDQAEWRT